MSPDSPARADTPERDWRSLDPRAKRLWRAAALLAAAAPIAGIIAFAFIFGEASSPPTTLAAAVVVGALGIVLAALWPPARYRAWGFRVRGEDVLIRRGVLWRTISVVPHTRIQHVDTRRGPLERVFGLARVVVYTAGTRGASITIPALAAAEAEALRDRLAELGAAGEAV